VDWHRGGDDGVGQLLERLVAELGGPPPAGTRTLPAGRELLRSAREIEDACAEAPTAAELLVGFQRAERLTEEAARYRDLVAAGVAVTAFGQGVPAAAPPGLRWVELGDDRTALVNQWFLVLRRSRPLAMVAFETTAGEYRFGRGGLRDPGRTWSGFVSDDARVVGAIAGHLDEVAAHA
jgi:hypothetical protein